MSEWQFDEKELKERRTQRIREMQKRKHRQMLFRRYSKRIICLAIAVFFFGTAGVVGGKAMVKAFHATPKEEEMAEKPVMIASGEQTGEETGGVQSAAAENNEHAETAGIEEEAVTTAGSVPAEESISAQGSVSAEESISAQGSVSTEEIVAKVPENTAPDPTEPPQIFEAVMSENPGQMSDEIISSYAVFIDLDRKEILTERESDAVISPASMTKVLTLLVAAEALEESDLDDTFTMTLDITDYSFQNDCSNVGFLENEIIPVKDLLYGTILPSGGDAAVGLATYVAGSHEAFVEMMNEKVARMGLSDTAHFTNCVGLYDEEHHCTVYDMAMIMAAALENELCREVLSAKKYTTTPTTEHPEGITISNWFLRRIEDKDTGGEVICAKTGFVNESGSCAVSYGVDTSGRQYICATADSTSSWRCIYDHVALYKAYAEESEAEDED